MQQTCRFIKTTFRFFIIIAEDKIRRLDAEEKYK